MMTTDNLSIIKFALNKLGTLYLMGTNGQKVTRETFDRLAAQNPNKWYTKARVAALKKLFANNKSVVATDCHGLLEWYLREHYNITYDITADMAFNQSIYKKALVQNKDYKFYEKKIPIGSCVRFPGHVGIYIGAGYVAEARGYNYNLCVTQLNSRPWTHFYYHKFLKLDTTSKITDLLNNINYIDKKSDKYLIAVMQILLNIYIYNKERPRDVLVIDGVWGEMTEKAINDLWLFKKWEKSRLSYQEIGSGALKTLKNIYEKGV